MALSCRRKLLDQNNRGKESNKIAEKFPPAWLLQKNPPFQNGLQIFDSKWQVRKLRELILQRGVRLRDSSSSSSSPHRNPVHEKNFTHIQALS